jgi:hypothetical protein
MKENKRTKEKNKEIVLWTFHLLIRCAKKPDEVVLSNVFFSIRLENFALAEAISVRR